MKRPVDGYRIGLVGKGGSGKSTLTALLAGALVRRGYEVTVLDADSTNVGLHEMLGVDREPRSLIEYFGGSVFSGGRVTCPVDDPTVLLRTDLNEDDLDPEYVGRNGAGVRLLAAGKLGDLGPGAGCDGPIAKIVRDVRLRTSGERSVTLIDCKAGFEDTARGVIVGFDALIAVVDPTAAAARMAVSMARVVDAIRAGGLPATEHLGNPELVALANRLYRESVVRHVFVVLNSVADEETESTLRRMLAEAGLTVTGRIGHHPELARAWLGGEPVSCPSADLEADRIAERIDSILSVVEPDGQADAGDAALDEELKQTFPASDAIARY